MSNKEMCINIINGFEEDQLENVVALLESVKKMIDESFDESFCMQLLNEYENDSDPRKSDTLSIEAFSKELGIELN